MKHFLLLISFLTIGLFFGSCSKSEDISCLTIEGDSTFFRPSQLESFRQIAQQEKINVQLLIVPDSVFTVDQIMERKATSSIFKGQDRDAIITYIEHRNMVLVETNSLFDVPMQKGLAKKLYRIQMQHETLPGYQAIKSVMLITAQAKQEANSSWFIKGYSFFSQMKDDLQWVLMPSNKCFFQILFKPAFILCQLLIRLFHSLRWTIIVLTVLYIFLSLFKVFKPEATYFCKVLRTLVLIMLVYTLLFCLPSFDNYLYGETIRKILNTSYISAKPQGGSIGWGILAIVLALLDSLRKFIIAAEKDMREGEYTTNRQNVETNNFAIVSLTFASVFVLPRVFLQAICLVLGSMLLTTIIEMVDKIKHLDKVSSLKENVRFNYTFFANILILIYFICGFICFFEIIAHTHQPWTWLQNHTMLTDIYYVGSICMIAVAGIYMCGVLVDFSDAQIQIANAAEQIQTGQAEMREKSNVLKNFGKSILYTIGLFVVIILGIYLLIR